MDLLEAIDIAVAKSGLNLKNICTAEYCCIRDLNGQLKENLWKVYFFDDSGKALDKCYKVDHKGQCVAEDYSSTFHTMLTYKPCEDSFSIKDAIKKVMQKRECPIKDIIMVNYFSNNTGKGDNGKDDNAPSGEYWEAKLQRKSELDEFHVVYEVYTDGRCFLHDHAVKMRYELGENSKIEKKYHKAKNAYARNQKVATGLRKTIIFCTVIFAIIFVFGHNYFIDLIQKFLDGLFDINNY